MKRTDISKIDKRKLCDIKIIFPSLLLGATISVNAETVIPSGSSAVTYSDDTSYLINSGTELISGSPGTNLVTISGMEGSSLINHGEISQTSNSPIDSSISSLDFKTSGNILNEVDGNIQGSGIGIKANSQGTGEVNITNKGDISSLVFDAIRYIGTGGTIDNYGTIGLHNEKGADGFYITDSDANSKVTIINELGAKIQTGPVSDQTTTAIEIGEGVYADIENKGEIISIQCGICAYSGSGAVVNIHNDATGVITSGSEGATGFSNSAIYLQTNSSLNNAGTISSVTAYAVDIESSKNTIINTGTIIGGDTEKTAIFLKGNDNTVKLGTGSTLTDGHSGSTAIQSVGNNNTLTLTGQSSESGIINGISQLTSESDSQWSLDGIVTLNGTTADTLNVNGNLTLNGTLSQTGTNAATSINNGGTLIVGDENHSSATLTGGDIAVAEGGILSGTGVIKGNIDNSGIISVFDALPSTLITSSPSAETGSTVNTLTLNGDVTNSGSLQLAGTSAGNVLTISGNYVGVGGLVKLNTELGNDNSATDKLVIEGSSTGNSNVAIYNLGGRGEQTTNGIQVIDVEGSDSSGTFSLQGRAVAGAYEYSLVQNSNGSWYLQSVAEPTPAPEPAPAPEPTPEPAPNKAQLRPEVGSYLANQLAVQSMFVNTLFDRIGNNFNKANSDANTSWGYITGKHVHQDSAGGSLTSKGDSFAIELGSDVVEGHFINADRWVVGVMGGIGQATTTSQASGVDANSHATVDGYNLGVYGTWFADSSSQLGSYIDSWFQYGWFNNKVNGDELAEERYDSGSQTASLETGYGFNIGTFADHNWVLEPQVQGIYMHYEQDDHTESNGTNVINGNGDGLIGRVGTRITATEPNGKLNGINPFVEANWWTGRAVANSIQMDGTTINSDTPQNRYELKTGLQGNLNQNMQAWVSVSGSAGDNSYYDYGGKIGFRYQF